MIIDYLAKHYDEIEQDMNNALKTTKIDGMPTPKTPDSNSIMRDTSVESLSSEDKSPGKKKSTITATKSICKHNITMFELWLHLIHEHT